MERADRSIERRIVAGTVSAITATSGSSCERLALVTPMMRNCPALCWLMTLAMPRQPIFTWPPSRSARGEAAVLVGDVNHVDLRHLEKSAANMCCAPPLPDEA